MALDVGEHTIGVAVCDELGVTVTGVVTVARRSYDKDFARLAEIVAEREIERIVVGLPLNMDGTEGPRAQKTRRFAAEAQARLGLPVVLHDERLSTFEAESRLRAAGVPKKRWKAVIDQAAAEVILESYLAAG